MTERGTNALQHSAELLLNRLIGLVCPIQKQTPPFRLQRGRCEPELTHVASEILTELPKAGRRFLSSRETLVYVLPAKEVPVLGARVNSVQQYGEGHGLIPAANQCNLAQAQIALQLSPLKRRIELVLDVKRSAPEQVEPEIRPTLFKGRLG